MWSTVDNPLTPHTNTPKAMRPSVENNCGQMCMKMRLIVF